MDNMKLLRFSPVILLKETWMKWRADNATGMAASLSYYTLFATVPLLTIIIAILGSIYGRPAIQFEIMRQISDLLGRDIASFIASVLEATRDSKNGTLVSLSSIFLLMGSIGAFNQLKWSLDKVWNAPARELRSWKRFVPDLGMFAMIIVFGFLLILSSIISAIVTIAANRVDDAQLVIGTALLASDIAIFFVLSSTLIATVFHVIPNMRLHLKDTLIGAMFTSVLFTLGRIGINIYLSIREIDSIYGAASSMIALLLWVYFSALLFYFGAEFTYVYANRRRYLAKDQLGSSSS